MARARKICGISSDSDRIRFHNVDICDSVEFEKVFAESPVRFKSCIHFASLKAVGESVSKPLLYYKNNLVGTLTLLELLDKYRCHSIVFSSSATVYGSAKVPITESTPVGVGISSPYGQTKYMLEEILRVLINTLSSRWDNFPSFTIIFWQDFKKSVDLSPSPERAWSVVILRYFNPVGAHPSGLIGENNSSPSHLVIPSFSSSKC